MSAHMDGITNPPIDELLDKAGSKYSLVLYAAKRARQINAYYSQLGEGLLEYVGPLVETHVQEKPLSIALREIDAGLLTSEAISEEEAAGVLYISGGAVVWEAAPDQAGVSVVILHPAGGVAPRPAADARHAILGQHRRSVMEPEIVAQAQIPELAVILDGVALHHLRRGAEI